MTLAAFAATAAAIVVSPGPDTVLILRSALASGLSAGLAAVLGVQIGLLLHTALAALGITALIGSSPLLFKAVALVGAAYLAWLGWSGLRVRGTLAMGGGGGKSSPALLCCRDALLTNVFNPKVIILFLALYPNFVSFGRADEAGNDGGGVLAQLALLSTVLIAINVVWQVGLVWFADRARRWLTRPAFIGWASRITGGILLLFAGLMLWEHLLRGS